MGQLKIGISREIARPPPRRWLIAKREARGLLFAYATLRLSGVEEFEILLVDRHALAEGDRRGLGAADQMHPAPGLVGGVVFSDDRLVMLEGVHLGEIVVAHDFGKTRDEGLRVSAD